MVIQLVTVSIRPEQRDRWLDLIRLNAAQTRAEEGCESYRISEDVETPNTFVIVERWASLEAAIVPGIATLWLGLPSSSPAAVGARAERTARGT